MSISGGNLKVQGGAGWIDVSAGAEPAPSRRIETVGSGVGVKEVYEGRHNKLRISVENDGIHVGCTVVTLEAWANLEKQITELLAARGA